jgi:hypothetical protein
VANTLSEFEELEASALNIVYGQKINEQELVE